MRLCDQCGKELRYNLVMAFWLNVTYYYCSIRHKNAHMEEMKDAYRKAAASQP